MSLYRNYDMLYEVIIGMEFIAAAFLLVGIIPFKRISADENLPFVNKIAFLLLASILFFGLGMLGSAYEIKHCYEDTATVVGNVTNYTGTCDLVQIQDPVLGYFNYGLGVASILLTIVTALIAAFSRNDYKYNQE